MEDDKLQELHDFLSSKKQQRGRRGGLGQGSSTDFSSCNSPAPPGEGHVYFSSDEDEGGKKQKKKKLNTKTDAGEGDKNKDGVDADSSCGSSSSGDGSSSSWSKASPLYAFFVRGGTLQESPSLLPQDTQTLNRDLVEEEEKKVCKKTTSIPAAVTVGTKEEKKMKKKKEKEKETDGEEKESFELKSARPPDDANSARRSSPSSSSFSTACSSTCSASPSSSVSINAEEMYQTKTSDAAAAGIEEEERTKGEKKKKKKRERELEPDKREEGEEEVFCSADKKKKRSRDESSSSLSTVSSFSSLPNFPTLSSPLQLFRLSFSSSSLQSLLHAEENQLKKTKEKNLSVPGGKEKISLLELIQRSLSKKGEEKEEDVSEEILILGAKGSPHQVSLWTKDEGEKAETFSSSSSSKRKLKKVSIIHMHGILQLHKNQPLGYDEEKASSSSSLSDLLWGVLELPREEEESEAPSSSSFVQGVFKASELYLSRKSSVTLYGYRTTSASSSS